MGRCILEKMHRNWSGCSNGSLRDWCEDRRSSRGGTEEENAKRKVLEQEVEEAQMRKRRRREVDAISQAVEEDYSEENAASSDGDVVLAASSCLNSGSTMKFTDPQEEDIASTKSNSEDAERSKTPAFEELDAEPVELGSPEMPQEASSRHSSPRPEIPASTPSLAELDDFFRSVEKNLQKQFANKYNYDIEKDEPLEGRYEWVQIKP